MKITRIETFLLKAPLGKDRFYWSQRACPERKSLLVRIRTDSGLEGWGECGQYGPGEPPAAFVNSVLGPRLIGKDPLQVGVLWEDMFTSLRDFGRKCAGIEALSGIDIALWDLAGKHYGKPIYELLGGAFRTKIRAYATGCYYRGDDVLDYQAALPALRDEAKGYVDAGFTGLKGKIGLLTIEEDVERVRAIREAVGDRTLLMMDANHAYNFHSARKMGKALESLGVLFFEEPVVPEDLDGYALLRQSLDLAIAGGEDEYTRYGFLELFRKGCVDIAQPDVCCAGGLTELKRIEALSTAFHVQLVPHVWGSGVALAAALHLCATLAPVPHTAFPKAPLNEPMIEFDKNPNPLRDDLLKGPIQLDGEFVPVPEGLGLGIEIDEEVLDKYVMTP
ncbi:MAG TPA: mandelate racemase/muconate lactonizing enzyme family protein [Thermoguttaceae bacterium]|nr:mandelate racemase/muconate lactonizing enzyme family protein [Thermoguttaceae bacterium]